MSALVLVPLADGRVLALTAETHKKVIEGGAVIMSPVPVDVHPSGIVRELFTAEQMEQRTGVPASWWLKSARERRVDCVMFGRYPRFDLAKLAEENSLPRIPRATNGQRIRGAG